MFLNISEQGLGFVLKLSNGDFSRSCECLVEGASLDSLLPLIRSATIKNDARRLRISEDEEEGDDLVE